MGCFIEVLARFRKSPQSAELMQRLGDIAHAPSDYTPAGVIPASWLEKRVIGTAEGSREQRYADIYSSEWLSYLRRELARSGAIETKTTDFDLSLLMSQCRTLTQRVATLVHRLGYQGIVYHSRLGAELLNWAAFEPFCFGGKESSEISTGDTDFQAALQRLDLVFDPSR